MKTADLIEQRAGIVSAMTDAHNRDDGETFTAKEAELRALDSKISRARAIDAAERSEPGRPINGDQKLDTEIRSKFSLCRLMASTFDQTVDAGFEREVQAELAKRAGKPAQGLYIPTEIFEKRVLTTSTGAEIVPTDHRPDLYVSALTAQSVVRSLGATVLSGLTGNLSIPRETGAPTIGWVAENAALSSSDPDFDSFTMSPKHAGAMSEYSRNMLLQSSPAVEQLLRNMLARDLALAIDAAAIEGGGTNEPDGVLATTGIQTEAYATSLFHTAAEMIEKADIANVGARRAFLSSNTVKKIAMATLDANDQPLGVDKIFHGEARMFSNQVPTNLGAGTNEHALIYGDWSELLLGIWSEVDILVNPFEATAYSKGNVKVRAMASVDCAVKRPIAFVSGTGVLATVVGVA